MKLFRRNPWFNGHPPSRPPATATRPAPFRGLLLGWDKETGAPVLYDGDAPILTCGMTGSGKGRGAMIPALLTYRGATFATDVKGELVQVTGRCRREMGHTVVRLDPCGLTAAQSDRLNPLDLLTLPGANSDADAQMLASLLAAGHGLGTDPFWSDTATSLIGGLIAHIATAYPPRDRHLGQLRAWLYHKDMDMALATALDRGHVRSRYAQDQFVAFLAAPPERTRPSILATACSFVNALCGEQAAAALSGSTFRLRDVYEGKPVDIFLVMPADKLESLRPLWRLWVGTLLTTVMRRPHIPEQRTLFLLDECAQLGELSALRQAVTLLRGSGLQVWSIWQDLSQLRQLYMQDWQTMVNNSAGIQLLSVPNHLMAREWSDMLGMEPASLARLDRGDAVVSIHGAGARIVRRPDYLAHPVFAGLYDPNPRFAQAATRRTPPEDLWQR